MKKTKLCMLGLCAVMLIGAIVSVAGSRSDASRYLKASLEKVEALAQTETIHNPPSGLALHVTMCKAIREIKEFIDGQWVTRYEYYYSMQGECLAAVTYNSSCQPYSCSQK